MDNALAYGRQLSDLWYRAAVAVQSTNLGLGVLLGRGHPCVDGHTAALSLARRYILDCHGACLLNIDRNSRIARDQVGEDCTLNFSPRETPRLLLRAIAIDDWRAIHRYMSDPLVTAWLPHGVLNEEQSQAFAIKNAGDKPEALAVVTRASSDLIGHLVFHPWFAAHTYEIGWVFGRQHQRLGYATEAARSLLAYAFESLHCHRVIATCQPENDASWRVMERLGMRREAHFHRCILRRPGEWWDEYFYAVLEEEYLDGCADRVGVQSGP